jgi:ADP-ribosylglycohydrolase
MVPPTLDQFLGSVLGLALGDALGAVVEGQPAGEAAHYVDLVLGNGRAGSRGRPPFEFGQVTDDTQLMRELLLSSADAGAPDPARFAERLRQFVAAGDLIGGGQAPVAATVALSQGVPWQQAGIAPPYAGNGAAMRAGPLGLMYGHDPARLTQAVVDQARVTHRDPRAAAGALVIALATARAADPRPIVPRDVTADIARQARRTDAGVAAAVERVADWAPLPMPEALAYLSDHPIGPECPWPGHGVSPFVTSSVCWSLYAFLHHPDSWWDAVCLAIRVGGDTDTLGAMTGTIAGARHGARALPEDLTSRLTDRGRWHRADLVALGERCYRLIR